LCKPFGASQFNVELAPKNDCVYDITCPKGHTFQANVLYHEFQKLFEVAIDALADGYHREAIGTFAASHERFIELFIGIVGTVNQIPSQQRDEMWGSLSRMSERQLGAFIALFVQTFKTQPPLLVRKLVELRNDVVHKGYFPTEEESLRYGAAVLASIRHIIGRLQSDQALENELARSLNDKGDFSPAGPQLTLYPFHLLGTNRSIANDVATIEHMVEQAKSRRSTERGGA
jgi:hypothetical protein